MIRYVDLVQYIKDNHINWNEDLFNVLRGFFEQNKSSSIPIQQEIEWNTPIGTFKEPSNGEYTFEDVINLLTI